MSISGSRIADIHQLAARIWDTIFQIHRLAWTVTTDYLTRSRGPYPEPLRFDTEPRLVTVSDSRARLVNAPDEGSGPSPGVTSPEPQADEPANLSTLLNNPEADAMNYAHTPAEWEHCLQVNQPLIDGLVQRYASLDGFGWQVSDAELAYFATAPVTLADGGTRESVHNAAFTSAKILQYIWPQLMGFGMAPPEKLYQSQLGWLAKQRTPQLPTSTQYPPTIPYDFVRQVVCYCRCLFVRGWTPVDGYIGIQLEEREAMGVADRVEGQVGTYLRAEQRLAEERLAIEEARKNPPPPPDIWSQLATLAQNKLAANQRKVVLALAQAKGRMPLADLKALCDWTSDDAWNSCRARVNKNLKRDGWRLRRHSNEVIAEQIPQTARSGRK